MASADYGDRLECPECGTIYDDSASRCPYCGHDKSQAIRVDPPRPTYGVAHRGGVILALGIFSIVCCQLAGPVAWIMGTNDLREMREGDMDPSGQGITQAGQICGIVGTVLLGVSVLAFILQIFLVVALEH